MTNWRYQDDEFNIKDLEPFWGFVYKVTNTKTGEFYYGSKSFFSRTNAKISKKRSNELYSGKGRKPLREKKIKESDWKTYITSSKKVQEMIKNFKDDFIFEIIALFNNKQEMLLTEAYYIAKHFLDRNPLILNDWLSIKSFKLK